MEGAAPMLLGAVPVPMPVVVVGVVWVHRGVDEVRVRLQPAVRKADVPRRQLSGVRRVLVHPRLAGLGRPVQVRQLPSHRVYVCRLLVWGKGVGAC